MKVRTEEPAQLIDFKLLSFDCFGTLVDWESGIYRELQPLRDRLPSTHPLKDDRALLIKRFNEIESAIVAAKPGVRYPVLLTESYLKLNDSLSLPSPSHSEAESLGALIGRWSAFPDTVEALQRLQKHYKLVILSNVDHKSFSETLAGALAGVKFDAVYTAEQIGSYKPDLRNFEFLLSHVRDELGVHKNEILHTAEGLTADHVPAKQMGLKSAWIGRGKGGGPGTALEAVKDKVVFTWQFETMGDMAEAADEEFARSQK